jgi:hypothetical protein
MRSSVARLTILSTIFLLILSACGSGGHPGPTPTPFGAMALVSQFRDLNDRLGGTAVLGPAISPPFMHDRSTCQYTENVLMCFNPDAKVDVERVTLVPIGQLLVTPPPGAQFKVFENFQSMYSTMFGTLYVGKPLTGGRYNNEKRRYEQYFEKMGFYQLIDDPRGTVHLMAYGSFVCAEHCTFEPPSESAVIGWNKGNEVPGIVSINRLGGFDFFGSPLSQPYTSSKDGAIEQVLDNVAYYIPKDNPSTILLRPLPLLLHVRQEAPGPQLYGKAQGMVFYPVKGVLGYHVPTVFDVFIAAHGGVALAGKPTSDPFHAEVNGVSLPRQCFENYCLEYDISAPENQRVHLVPLGSLYLKQTVSEDKWVFKFSPKTTKLTVSEKYPEISSKEEQVIQVNVSQVNGLQPLSDIDAVLVVEMPDGSKVSYNVPSTDLQGSASVKLPPISNAANGTVVPFVVCLNVPTDTQICEAQSFLIWNAR